MFRIKSLTFIFSLIITFSSFAQVGISNTSPEAALDVTSTNSGILIPRVNLNSLDNETPVINPTGNDLVEGTMVYNTGAGRLTENGFYYWNGSSWSKLIDKSPDVYFGTALITTSSPNSFSIDAIPFQPKRITFTAYANVDNFNLQGDSGGNNNANNKENFHGSMRGYAQQTDTGIEQQVIFNGGSGSSINDISRYASNSHCVGIRYANNNGESPVYTTASLASFNADGFTLTLDNKADNVLIIYEAYRY